MCHYVCVCRLRHGHPNTACLPTAVLSNSSEMYLFPEAKERLQKTSVCHCRHVWFTSLSNQTLSAMIHLLIILQSVRFLWKSWSGLGWCGDHWLSSRVNSSRVQAVFTLGSQSKWRKCEELVSPPHTHLQSYMQLYHRDTNCLFSSTVRCQGRGMRFNMFWKPQMDTLMYPNMPTHLIWEESEEEISGKRSISVSSKVSTEELMSDRTRKKKMRGSVASQREMSMSDEWVKLSLTEGERMYTEDEETSDTAT